MSEAKDPMVYAEEIIELLSKTDARRARTAIKIAVPLLEYRIFNAPEGVFPELPGPWSWDGAILSAEKESSVQKDQ
jgi:hypothetical protein